METCVEKSITDIDVMVMSESKKDRGLLRNIHKKLSDAGVYLYQDIDVEDGDVSYWATLPYDGKSIDETHRGRMYMFGSLDVLVMMYTDCINDAETINTPVSEAVN